MTRPPYPASEFEVRAAACFWDEEGECDVLVATEREDGSGRRLEVQLAAEFDDHDEAHGMNTYCLVDERGATHYGDVARWFDDSGVLVIELDDPAAHALELSAFRLDTTAHAEARETILRALSRLIGPASMA